MENILDNITSICFLHKGGEGIVYKGVGKSKKLYTLKWYNNQISFDKLTIETLQKIKSQGIYNIVESGIKNKGCYLIYDYIEGISSKEISPMPLLFALYSLKKVTQALKEVQKNGVSHGDLNPSNVFFDLTVSPILIDFGIVGPGSVLFSAPERFFNSKPSEKSDLFSLGLLLFYWITGESFFEESSFEKIREKVNEISFKEVNQKLYHIFVSKNEIVNPEIYSVLELIWKGLLQQNPSERVEDFDELEEILDIVIDKLGGNAIVISKETNTLKNKIEDLIKNKQEELYKTENRVDFPFNQKKKRKISKKIMGMLILGLFILFYIIYVGLIKDESFSIDNTSKLLMHRTKSSQMDTIENSEDMPNLENVIQQLNTEMEDE